MARDLSNRGYNAQRDRSFVRETPVGNLYGGMLNNYPLKSGGNMSNAWLGLGDLEARANKWDFPGQNPEYAAGINFPDSVNLPNVYGEVNTPLGLLFGGTNDGNPNINVGFQPNDRTSAYMNAIAKALLGGR